MKQARSHLIETFLFNVNNGNVIGAERSSGPSILRQVADAMQEILDGEKPDTALKIERGPGGRSLDKTFIVALIMHSHAENGRKNIAAAEKDANNWLEATGYKRLGERRLRDIRNQHESTIERMESYTEMVKMLEQRFPKTE